MLGRAAEARDLLLAEAPLIAGLHDPALSGVYHFWLAYASSNLADSARAQEYAKRALEEAARGGDEMTMGRASFELSRESYILGRPLEGIPQGRQAVALLERTNDHWWLGQALCILALNLLHIGDFVPALDAMEQARALGEAIGDVQLQAEAAGTTARIYAVMGEGEAAIAAGERSVTHAPDLVTRMRMIGWLAAAHQENGEAARAIRLFEEALELVGSTSYRARQVDSFMMALLSDALRVDGQMERAADLAGRALAVSTAGGWSVPVGYAYRALGRIALASGKLEDAESAQRQSIETFEKVDARCQVARSRLDLAEVLKARGDRNRARAELEIARGAFTQMQAPRLVERASRGLAALGSARG
jgi:tetratricopeptide (TPR) repeat protein